MTLLYEEVEDYLLRIFTGIEYVTIQDKFLVFKHPTNEIKQRVNLKYKQAYDKAIKYGMLPKEDLQKLIKEKKLFTDEDERAIKKLQDQLEAQGVLLSKTTRIRANQDRILGVMERLKTEILKIESKRQSTMYLSAENKADEERTFCICRECVYKEDGSLYWSSYEDALNETALGFKDSVLLKFIMFYGGIRTPIIREVSRHNLWRIRYINSQKTSETLFGVPTSEYSVDQLNLVYWSNFYQNVYEMLPEDRPSDTIIEDDNALDAYLKAYYEERNREDAARRSQKTSPGKLSAFDREEVIVTRSHELYEDIEYNTPKEAQRIKDRVDIKKRTKRG
jgi:hypothetical protein